MAQQKTFTPDDFIEGFDKPADKKTAPVATASKTFKEDDFATTPTDITKKLTPAPVNKLAEKVAPYVEPAAGIAAGMATAAAVPEALPEWVPGLTASTTMAALSNLLKKSRPDQSYLGNVAQDATINEVGGRLVNPLLKGSILGLGGMFGAVAPKMAENLEIPTIDEAFQKFRPTVAQLTKSKLLELVENSFAPTSKRKALTFSGNFASDRAQEMVKDLAGNPDIKIDFPFAQIKNINNDIQSAFNSSVAESTKRGTAAKIIAKANPELVPQYTADPVTGILSPSTPLKVEGKVIPKNLLATATQMLDDINKLDTKPDPNSPLMQNLKNIINNSQMLDANGKTVAKPRSFAEMWNNKQNLDTIGSPGSRSELDFSKSQARDLAKAYNDDIEQSIPSWSTNPDVAKQLYLESKQIVAARHDTFDPIQKVVNSEVGDIPAINKVIDNPDLLKKSMIAGKLQIPDGDKFTYITNNTRRDLQGYQLQRMVRNAFTKDEQGNVTLDGQKLLDQFHDPNSQESMKALYSAKNRADIDQFFKNTSMTNAKTPVGASRYWTMRLGANGLGLAAGLLTGVSASGIGGGTIIGATLGLNALGRLLTNPDSARLMVGLAQNGPLNMSTKLAGRVIMNQLRNQYLTVKMDDGSEVQAKVNATGDGLTLPVGKGEIK